MYNEFAPGWLAPGDIRALSALASAVPNKGVIVEVGSMHGRSACCFAEVAHTTSIHCFDLWPGYLVVDSAGQYRNNSIEVFKSFTSKYSNIYPTQVNPAVKIEWYTPVDLVFIDAAHTNPTDWESIEFWLPFIKRGGILCGHDYYTLEVNQIIHFPNINENITRLEKLLGQKVTAHKESCIWSFVV